MLRRLFQTKKLKTSLGRWALAKTMKEQQIKIIMANHDSCGGKLCECYNMILWYYDITILWDYQFYDMNVVIIKWNRNESDFYTLEISIYTRNELI